MKKVFFLTILMMNFTTAATRAAGNENWDRTVEVSQISATTKSAINLNHRLYQINLHAAGVIGGCSLGFEEQATAEKLPSTLPVGTKVTFVRANAFGEGFSGVALAQIFVQTSPSRLTPGQISCVYATPSVSTASFLEALSQDFTFFNN